MGTLVQAERSSFDYGATGVAPELGRADHPRRQRLRSLTWPRPPRPPLAKLERACRIALMETDQPLSVEAIYDRIVRRESFVFSGHKRPFRAIAFAMARLARRGEAIVFATWSDVIVLRNRAQRVWRRAITAPPQVTPARTRELSGQYEIRSSGYCV